MAFPVFTPPLLPSTGSGYSVKVRTINNQFGDGYRQVVPDGLNAAPLTMSLTWNMLTIAQADTVEGFFKYYLGQVFWWTPPRFAAAVKWDCLEWSRKAVSGAHDSMTATFTQRFDLGV